jgi:hypothetical protein
MHIKEVYNMNKIITTVLMMFFLTSNVVHAELDNTGTVNSIDLERGFIVINRTRYLISYAKTKLSSGLKNFDLGLLTSGTNVNFELDSDFVSKIEYNPPIELR